MKLLQARVFLYKSSFRTKHNRHCIIGFFIDAAILNVDFIIHYHLFLRKEIYFSECLYFSKCDVRMFLYVFWLRRRGPSIKCVRCRCGEGDHPKCVQGGERCHTSCVPISFHVFGSFFCLIAFCFICKNLSLPLFKKDVLSKTVILLQRDQFLSS